MTKSSRPSVAILLGTWNGAAHLDEQLQSFVDQSWANWSLHVSDDGSRDATKDIIRAFAASVPQRVELRDGPRSGFVDNFLGLARDEAIVADLFAFSDQDDIWYPEKLRRAVDWFASLADASTPAVYFSRTELIGPQGQPRGYSTLFRRPPGFHNALVQNIGGANTMVFNQAARSLLQAAGRSPAVSHDWCLYLLVTAIGGIAFYDPAPTLKYRQHDGNVMGSNRGFRAVKKRIELLLQGQLRQWNAINRKLLQGIETRLSADNRTTLHLFAEAGVASLPTRLIRLKQSGVYRQTRLGDVGLVVAALLGKL